MTNRTDVHYLHKYLVLDGGLSTELVSEYGFTDIDNDPLWSARLINTNPSALQKVHTAFLQSGADIIETATYQASVQGFIKHCGMTESEAKETVTLGAKLAVQARDIFCKENEGTISIKPLVAASIGPYGAYLHDGSEYTGNYVDDLTQSTLMNWHRQQLDAILKADVDIIAFDTIPAMKEAEAIIALLEEYPNVKCWISYSCSTASTTSHGDKFTDAVKALSSSEQVIGIGINCTAPDLVEDLLDLIPPALKETKRVIVYPNSGEEWTAEKTWFNRGQFKTHAEYAPLWIEKGAHWIGGCCRVTAKDICDVRSVVDKLMLNK